MTTDAPLRKGVRDGLSASAIARRLDVSPSSVTREVQIEPLGQREPKRKSVRQARKCGAYDDCRKRGPSAHNACSSRRSGIRAGFCPPWSVGTSAPTSCPASALP